MQLLAFAKVSFRCYLDDWETKSYIEKNSKQKKETMFSMKSCWPEDALEAGRFTSLSFTSCCFQLSGFENIMNVHTILARGIMGP